ncbi:YcxB family protein [Streptomyces bicolor]|uniref:YcxB family protein n=1 Tax=Streptomyces bicolor TaxID=66874 RepID=UPI000B109ADF|nr:YcxB family protein [Streptomyces bicolor]
MPVRSRLMVMDMGRDAVQGAVELVYSPMRADLIAGVRVRERRRHLHLVRWGFTALFGWGVVLVATARDSSVVSFVTAVFCAALTWSIPHLQAHHAWRTISWQGEYRTSVGEMGITTETEHVTLVQRWPVFRGYRETRDHLVLLSRDPNILLVEVLPKRGLSAGDDLDRLRALLDDNLPRV